MKKLLFAALCLFTTQIALAQLAQKISKADSSKVFVRETINVTSAYKAKKSTPGTFLLATSKSGYKVFVQIKKNGESKFFANDPKGAVIPTVARKKVITTEGRTICMECLNVNRPGGTTEECYEVKCKAEDIIAAGTAH